MSRSVTLTVTLIEPSDAELCEAVTAIIGSELRGCASRAAYRVRGDALCWRHVGDALLTYIDEGGEPDKECNP